MTEISIIPQPQKIENIKGEIAIPKTLYFYSDFLETATHIENILEIRATESSEKAFLRFEKDLDFSDEEYSLKCTQTGINIKAATEQGAFYAVQTLRQIINYKADKIKCCEINDYPRYKMRSFMLDESRHFFGKSFVKKCLDVMASLKLNTFHWHLTDDQGWRIEIKTYPLLTEKGSIRRKTQLNMIGTKFNKTEYGKNCFYTQEDIKEIVKYAKDRHIEIIPEIDMPGHMMAAIACYPELSCKSMESEVSTKFGVQTLICCAGKDFTYEFAEKVIGEICNLFPGKYIHLGGDEVPKKEWKICDCCQKRISDFNIKDEKELQGHFLDEVAKMVRQQGKQPIMWNEALECNIKENVIIQWWMGSPKKKGIIDRMNSDGKIIISYMPFLYMDHFYAKKDLKKSYSLDLSTINLDEKYEKHILGIEAPQWTEYIRTKEKFEFNTFPRMQVLAEISWSEKEKRNFDDFKLRLNSFEPVLNKYDFSSAPQTAYLCSGFSGVIRKILCPLIWLFNPDYELKHKKHAVK